MVGWTVLVLCALTSAAQAQQAPAPAGTWQVELMYGTRRIDTGTASAACNVTTTPASAGTTPAPPAANHDEPSPAQLTVGASEEEQVAALVRALNDRDASVRQSAAFALECIFRHRYPAPQSILIAPFDLHQRAAAKEGGLLSDLAYAVSAVGDGLAQGLAMPRRSATEPPAAAPAASSGQPVTTQAPSPTVVVIRDGATEPRPAAQTDAGGIWPWLLGAIFGSLAAILIGGLLVVVTVLVVRRRGPESGTLHAGAAAHQAPAANQILSTTAELEMPPLPSRFKQAAEADPGPSNAQRFDLGPSYEEEQRFRAEAKEQGEKAVLQQIFEDNMKFLEAIEEGAAEEEEPFEQDAHAADNEETPGDEPAAEAE